MGAAANKQNARRLILELISGGNTGLVNELLSDDFIEHDDVPGIPPTRQGFMIMMTGMRAAFPDLKYTIEGELAEGDLVADRLTATATMKGEFMGMPPTGKTATWQEIHISRFDASGKMAEHWSEMDEMGMMQQLGFGPPAA
jgi:predicted ester cyclase